MSQAESSFDKVPGKNQSECMIPLCLACFCVGWPINIGVDASGLYDMTSAKNKRIDSGVHFDFSNYSENIAKYRSVSDELGNARLDLYEMLCQCGRVL